MIWLFEMHILDYLGSLSTIRLLPCFAAKSSRMDSSKLIRLLRFLPFQSIVFTPSLPFVFFVAGFLGTISCNNITKLNPW
jgi:hypothetical protein